MQYRQRALELFSKNLKERLEQGEIRYGNWWPKLREERQKFSDEIWPKLHGTEEYNKLMNLMILGEEDPYKSVE